MWGVFLNNQTVKQAILLPNGQFNATTRYIFIEGRNLPIILTDLGATPGPQNWAVGVNDGVNPAYQLGYEGGGNIQITLNAPGDVLQSTANSGFGAAVINNL